VPVLNEPTGANVVLVSAHYNGHPLNGAHQESKSFFKVSLYCRVGEALGEWVREDYFTL
jgi:hypothetical protein